MVALTNGHIFVGNSSNIATDVAMSGDTAIDNTGAVTLVTPITTTGTENIIQVTSTGANTSTGERNAIFGALNACGGAFSFIAGVGHQVDGQACAALGENNIIG